MGKGPRTCLCAIKKVISEPPVLHLPRSTGGLILYSDMSREHTSTFLSQKQEEKPHLIGYASKTLPSTCKNYSVTELEMTRLLVNIGCGRLIFKGVNLMFVLIMLLQFK